MFAVTQGFVVLIPTRRSHQSCSKDGHQGTLIRCCFLSQMVGQDGQWRQPTQLGNFKNVKWDKTCHCDCQTSLSFRRCLYFPVSKFVFVCIQVYMPVFVFLLRCGWECLCSCAGAANHLFKWSSSGEAWARRRDDTSNICFVLTFGKTFSIYKHVNMLNVAKHLLFQTFWCKNALLPHLGVSLF